MSWYSSGKQGLQQALQKASTTRTQLLVGPPVTNAVKYPTNPVKGIQDYPNAYRTNVNNIMNYNIDDSDYYDQKVASMAEDEVEKNIKKIRTLEQKIPQMSANQKNLNIFNQLQEKVGELEQGALRDILISYMIQYQNQVNNLYQKKDASAYARALSKREREIKEEEAKQKKKEEYEQQVQMYKAINGL